MPFIQSMSINKAVTLVPIALLVMVSLIQGVFEYINDMENAIKNRVELAKVSAQPIVNLMNHSVGGGNYANIQDEDALNLFRANKAVQYLSVRGKTDLKSNDFAALYDAQTHIIYRTIYSDDYLTSREKKLARIDVALSKSPQGHKKRVKLTKMQTRLTSEINQFEQQKKITEQLNNKHQKPSAELIKNYYYLDFEKAQLHLVLPLKNKRGGELWMVLDVSEIKSLWKDILFDILPLTCLLLTIAIILMLFISRSINRPLSKMLATVQHVEIDSDLSQRIESSNVSELNHLADAFNSMMEKFQGIIADAGKVSVSTTEAAVKMAGISEQGSIHLQEQQQQIDVVNQAMKEMTEAVGHVTENINQAVAVAKDTHESAEQGYSDVKQPIDKINLVSSAVESASQATGKVASSVENISSIVEKNLLGERLSKLAVRMSTFDSGFTCTLYAEMIQLLKRIRITLEKFDTGKYLGWKDS